MRRTEIPVTTASRPTVRRGFTLTEILIVMLIITVLMSLLVPVISKVRNAAYQAATQQEIDRIANGIVQYYNDSKLSGSGYPGVFKNDDLGTGNVPAIAGIANPKNITETENMELSLLGGLIWNGTTLTYDPGTLRASKGPISLLNSTNPAQYQAYVTAGSNDLISVDINGNINGAGSANAGLWNPTPNAAGAQDSEIPEFADQFTSPKPIVYLRAKVGMVNTCDGPAAGTASLAQYNYAHLAPYFSTTLPIAGGGGTPAATAYNNYFANTQVPQVNGQYQPKQQNGFWLISAGLDGIYGTTDDICYGFQF